MASVTFLLFRLMQRCAAGIAIARWSLFVAALFAAAAYAQTPPNFNHSSTGFTLQGVHARLQCSSCHGAGLPTRGIPKDCNTCHVQGGMRAATFKSPTHIPTPPAQSCLDCHNQNNFTPAVMKHTGDMAGQCVRCHNSLQAPGKPLGHIPTVASCDTCHTTGRWVPTKAVTHDATTIGRCSTCHNGTIASGKPPTHIQTNAQCDTCHTSTVTWLNAQFLHDVTMVGRCSTCHNNQTAKGRPAGHIPTNSQCDTCHTSFIAFNIRVMNHTGLVGQCSTCHSGAYLSQNAQMKPPTHVPTTAQCDSCHTSTTTWATKANPHPAFAPVNNCVSCHNSVTALGKPTTHIPVGTNCEACHLNNNYVAFRPAAMNHTGLTGRCSTCHSGGYVAMNAQTKPAIHIPTSLSCDVCHKSGFVVWYPGFMNHAGTAGQCSNCHSGAYLSENAQMKPVTHTPTTAQCDSCHTTAATTLSWATAGKPNHTGFVANCTNAGCHIPGGGGLNKPTNHIPTAAMCDKCHNTTSFRPLQVMDHTGTAGQCNTCHNGSFTYANAAKQGATHIPDTRQCDACHGQPANIAPGTGSFTNPPLSMNHTGLNGKCNTCHNGGYLTEGAQRQGATHIPDTRQCDTCHGQPASFPFGTGSFTSPLPRMNHTGLAGRCTTCHNGGYLSEVGAAPGLGAQSQAQASPAHIPDARQCDTCHTDASYISWVPHLMNHTGLNGRCLTCHNGSYTGWNAQTTQPGLHIPVTGIQCDACHTSTTVWTPTYTMNHTAVAAISCYTCHNGAYTNQGLKGGAQATTFVANHIPFVGVLGTLATLCNSCHTSTTAWTTEKMNHNNMQTGCTTCHLTGAIYLGSMRKNSLSHSGKGTDCSQNGCHIPVGKKGKAYSSWT